MNAERREISLGFTDEKFKEGLHMCYIFRDEDERRRTIAKYLGSGLDNGEKILYEVDSPTPGEFMDALEELGFRPGEREKDIKVSHDFPIYRPDGGYSLSEMVDVFGKFYAQARSEGYVGARAAGNMNWALVDGKVQGEDLMHAEAGMNQFLKICPCTICCQYDARKFSGSILMDVLAVHPVMIVRGQIVKNPYYVEPEAFINELKARSSKTDG